MADRRSRELEETLRGDSVHRTWARAYRNQESDPFYESAFDALARHLGRDLRGAVLDAGCGSAAHSIRLAKRGYRVIGVDFSPAALAMAAERVEENGLTDRITLKREDLLALTFADGTFPAVLCWGVLMHVADIERALDELTRVTAAGGLLILSENNTRSIQSVARRVFGSLARRAPGSRQPAGIEYWREADGGRLLTREANVDWLVDALARRECRLRARLPGQFTELYVFVPWAPMRGVVHRWNRFWFRRIRRPELAFGNILIFERTVQEESRS